MSSSSTSISNLALFRRRGQVIHSDKKGLKNFVCKSRQSDMWSTDTDLLAISRKKFKLLSKSSRARYRKMKFPEHLQSRGAGCNVNKIRSTQECFSRAELPATNKLSQRVNAQTAKGLETGLRPGMPSNTMLDSSQPENSLGFFSFLRELLPNFGILQRTKTTNVAQKISNLADMLDKDEKIDDPFKGIGVFRTKVDETTDTDASFENRKLAKKYKDVICKNSESESFSKNGRSDGTTHTSATVFRTDDEFSTTNGSSNGNNARTSVVISYTNANTRKISKKSNKKTIGSSKRSTSSSASSTKNPTISSTSTPTNNSTSTPTKNSTSTPAISSTSPSSGTSTYASSVTKPSKASPKSTTPNSENRKKIPLARKTTTAGAGKKMENYFRTLQRNLMNRVCSVPVEKKDTIRYNAFEKKILSTQPVRSPKDDKKGGHLISKTVKELPSKRTKKYMERVRAVSPIHDPLGRIPVFFMRRKK